MSLREKLKIIEEVDSTNLYAKRNLAELDDGTVISAQRQTNGHGRFDRAWVDLGEGNIFMSLVLKPSDSYSEVFPNLTQYFSVILCEILEEYGVIPQIKWPNDVLINGKKIAGILSETVVQGQKFKGFILGAGINLNACEKSVSQIKDKEVTALNLETGKIVDKSEFLEKLVNKFFKNYDEFLQKGFGLIENSYMRRACFLGKEISVKVFNETKNGIAKEINDCGELVLLEKDKETILTMGDIL